MKKKKKWKNEKMKKWKKIKKMKNEKWNKILISSYRKTGKQNEFWFWQIEFQYFFEFNKADVDRDMFLRNQRLVTGKKK